MAKTHEYAYHLTITSVIALIVSLIGAYVSFSKFLDWGVVKDVLGRAESLAFDVAVSLVFLIAVLKAVSFSLFRKGSSGGRKEAEGKH